MRLDRSSRSIPTRGFFGTWLFLFQHHMGLFAIFICCIGIVAHIILTTIPPSTCISPTESLLELAKKTQQLGQNASVTPVFTIAGTTLSDQNDYLKPNHLGFREIPRSSSNVASFGAFDVDLWDDKLARRNSNGEIVTSRPLPTSTWWQPWVSSPGTGFAFSINQHPYTLSVISKEQMKSVIGGSDRAGLEIDAPYVEVIEGREGSVFGVQQSRSDRRIGLFMGVKLVDLEDFVERHYVEDYGPLEVVKRWDLSISRRDKDGITWMPKIKTEAHLRTRVIRGSSFISMEVPAGVYFILDSLPQQISKGLKNPITRITSFSSTISDHASSCTGLKRSPAHIDAIEILLSDQTKWVLMFDQKISLTCVPTVEGDRLQSLGVLSSSLLARLALLDMSDHEDVLNGVIPGAKKMSPEASTKRSSEIRWRLLAYVKQHANNSISKFVSDINKKGTNIDKTLRETFTKFPLKKQLESLASSMNFNITIKRWNESDILQTLNTNKDITLVVVPENFIETPNQFEVSEHFKNVFKSYHIGTLGKSILGVAGTQSGTISTFFDKVFDIKIRESGRWDPKVDKEPQRLKDIEGTYPMRQNSINTDPKTLPHYMPKTLKKPKAGNSVEMIRGRPETGWPFISYCRPSSFGSSVQNKDSCDGAVHAYFFMGRGGVQWIGMDWANQTEDSSSNWIELLARSIQASACTEGAQIQYGTSSWRRECRPLGRILLISDVHASYQEDMIEDLKRLILVEKQIKQKDGNVTKQNAVDISKTLNFLGGTKKEITGNIGQEIVTLVDEDTESLRDFVLRHALMVPIGSAVEIDTTDSSGILHYQMKVKAINDLERHSLYPPKNSTSSDLLWDPYRSMFYLTELHRKLEYADKVGRFATLGPNSLEDDKTTCVQSVVGSLCARSFGPSPKCRIPDFIPSQSVATSRPNCSFVDENVLDKRSWDPEQVRKDLLAGKLAVFGHQKGGAPTGILINFPTATWDYRVKTSTGLFKPLQKLIHPKWVEMIKWAILEDVQGIWRLDGDVWCDNGAADDLGVWVRMIHRYAQIALIADTVGLWNEKRTAIKWLEQGLLKLFSNRFDNIGLLYDTTLGGIVPCGCDREKGRNFCLPPPRIAYFNNLQTRQSTSVWMSESCPALTSPTEEGGAGFFSEHHSLWGYIVYSAAVATKFNPTFANRRVYLNIGSGMRRPKIHHIVMSLIQDYANPMFVPPYSSKESPEIGTILQRFFPGARYKDWWRLHSYGSGVGTNDGSGPSQYSLSEAAFGYWAASLYAMTVDDKDLGRWTKLLAGMEIMAGNAFWHIKEYTRTVPTALRYLGSVGKVAELSISFQTKYSIAPYEVFHSQVLPLNSLSFETLEPGWVSWMHERWQSACQQDRMSCEKSGAYLGLVLMNFMTQDWEQINGVESLTTEAQKLNATNGIKDAVKVIANIPCFQMGSYDCGTHTLSNSIFWTALAYTWGGTPAALLRENGNVFHTFYDLATTRKQHDSKVQISLHEVWPNHNSDPNPHIDVVVLFLTTASSKTGDRLTLLIDTIELVESQPVDITRGASGFSIQSFKSSVGWKQSFRRLLFSISGLKEDITPILCLLPLQFKDSTLELAYSEYIAPTFVGRTRICGIIGSLCCLLFWITIGACMAAKKLPPINEIQEKGFHITQAITVMVLSFMAVTPNVPHIKNHLEAFNYLLFAIVFSSFGIWAVVTAATADFDIKHLPFVEQIELLTEGIKFKIWSDIVALFQYCSTVLSIDLMFQSRTRISWIIHSFMFAVFSTAYVVEVVKFDKVFELKIIVYLQVLLLFGIGTIGIGGRFNKEVQERFDFYKWIKQIKRMKKMEEELAGKKKEGKGSTAVEELIDLIKKSKQGISDYGVVARTTELKESENLLKQCLDILSNTDNLYSIRFANLDQEGEEVVAQFMAVYAEKKELTHKIRSRVRFASTMSDGNSKDTSAMSSRQLLEKGSRTLTDTSDRSIAVTATRNARRNGSLSAMALPAGVRLGTSCYAASTDAENSSDEYDLIEAMEQGFSSFKLPSIHRMVQADSLKLRNKLQSRTGNDWGLDLLALENETPNILVEVGACLILPFLDILCVEEEIILLYLNTIQNLYLPNPYHNQIHGAVVAHFTICTAKYLNVHNSMEFGPVDQVALIVAALGHDAGHPGRNNQFFVSTLHPLAVVYNDNSILENYHCCLTFRAFEGGGNIFSSLYPDTFRIVRSRIIELILSTDMKSHFESISRFRIRRAAEDFDIMTNGEDLWFVTRMCIKFGDLSHSSFDWRQHLQWSFRVTEEFYQQGDQEALLGISRSPMCDRSAHENFAKSQRGFIEFVVQPLLKELEAIDENSPIGTECIRRLMYNKYKWDEMARENRTAPIPDNVLQIKTQFHRLCSGSKRSKTSGVKKYKKAMAHNRKDSKREATVLTGSIASPPSFSPTATPDSQATTTPDADSFDDRNEGGMGQPEQLTEQSTSNPFTFNESQNEYSQKTTETNLSFSDSSNPPSALNTDTALRTESIHESGAYEFPVRGIPSSCLLPSFSNLDSRI